MSITFTCDDKQTLVSYLYGEIDHATRQAVDAHLATCAACAAEVTALGDARSELGLWVPPEVELDFTIVKKSDAPRTGRQVVNCRICFALAKAHGADPNTDAPPKFPFLEDGVGQQTPPSVDKPGDSGVTGKGKKGESIDLPVSAPAGTKLWMMCLIHPWMQAEIDVT